MVGTVTEIIVTVAAVIGLVPLGVRTVHDMIKSHRRKKSNEMLLTVALSVIASHAAPAVLADLSQRLGAVGEHLPPWAKAALGSLPSTTEEKPETSLDQDQLPDPSQNGRVAN